MLTCSETIVMLLALGSTGAVTSSPTTTLAFGSTTLLAIGDSCSLTEMIEPSSGMVSDECAVLAAALGVATTSPCGVEMLEAGLCRNIRSACMPVRVRSRQTHGSRTFDLLRQMARCCGVPNVRGREILPGLRRAQVVLAL